MATRTARQQNAPHKAYTKRLDIAKETYLKQMQVESDKSRARMEALKVENLTLENAKLRRDTCSGNKRY